MKPETAARLMELRRRGNPGVAPLWASALPAEEALTALDGVGGAWAELVRADALARMGRTAEARALLDSMAGVGGTLAAIRDEVVVKLGKAPACDIRLVELEAWLASVRAWRSAASAVGVINSQGGL